MYKEKVSTKFLTNIVVAILLIIAIFFGNIIVKQYDFSILSNDAVSIQNWLPFVVSLISVGILLRTYYIDRNLLLIILWPIIHMLMGVIILVYPILILFFLLPPFSFFGEAISIGFILGGLIKKNEIKNRTTKMLMIIFLLINLVIIGFAISDMSHNEIRGF